VSAAATASEEEEAAEEFTEYEPQEELAEVDGQQPVVVQRVRAAGQGGRGRRSRPQASTASAAAVSGYRAVGRSRAGSRLGQPMSRPKVSPFRTSASPSREVGSRQVAAEAAADAQPEMHFERSPSVSSSQAHDTPRAASDATPSSPAHGVWLAEPTSIGAPLLMLDEFEVQDHLEAETAALREELSDARAAGKADRAAVEALATSNEELERQVAELRTASQRLEQETGVLHLQLQNHHGIMAADWEQTLGFQERLRQEEAVAERLSVEAAELRAGLAARTEEAAQLRKDATSWRILSRMDLLGEVSSEELDRVLESAMPAITRLHAESRARAKLARNQLRDELEQQLCAVCKDAKKAVLFLPCQHLCVCEGCRGKLRPYRCPMCQVPVQSHISRVHF